MRVSVGWERKQCGLNRQLCQGCHDESHHSSSFPPGGKKEERQEQSQSLGNEGTVDDKKASLAHRGLGPTSPPAGSPDIELYIINS